MATVKVSDFFRGTGLVLAPHMDDESLACGGTLAMLPEKAGWHVVFATDSSGAPAPTGPGRAKAHPDIQSVRRQETLVALDILGVPGQNIHFLDFPDGRLRHCRTDLERAVGKIVHELQPDHLLAPFRYDRHPDHLALNRVAIKLSRNGEIPMTLTEYFTYTHWQLLPGRDIRRYIRRESLHRIDTSGVADDKRRALDCYKSQTTCFMPWQVRPVLSPALLEETVRGPEFFLRRNAASAKTPVFQRAGAWIRFVHRVEPVLKGYKEYLGSWWRDARAGR